MRFDHKTSLFISTLVFIVLVFVGFLLSQRKAVWTDEFFTQKVSVDAVSYTDILTSNFPDGNRCPLFYIFQNIVSDIFSYKLPTLTTDKVPILLDQRSQIIMRIPANICMSLALAGIFYYFIRFFSLFSAIYALAVAFVSPMIWMYWVEARPYSLWFLLTTAQLLLFCTTVHYPKIKVSRPIYWIHLLLVLTTPGSIFQVLIISAMLLFKSKYQKRQMIWACVVPTCIFLFYYLLVPIFKIKTFFFFTILYEVVLPEHLFVYIIYALAAWGLGEKRKDSSSNTFFLPVFLLFLLSVLFVLVSHVFTKDYQFGLFNRYLIYMVPADILMFTLASLDLWKWSRRNPWVCMNVSIVLIGFVIVRGLMTLREIWATALYLHSPG